jgi:hypothetical protein
MSVALILSIDTNSLVRGRRNNEQYWCCNVGRVANPGPIKFDEEVDILEKARCDPLVIIAPCPFVHVQVREHSAHHRPSKRILLHPNPHLLKQGPIPFHLYTNTLPTPPQVEHGTSSNNKNGTTPWPPHFQHILPPILGSPGGKTSAPGGGWWNSSVSVIRGDDWDREREWYPPESDMACGGRKWGSGRWKLFFVGDVDEELWVWVWPGA